MTIKIDPLHFDGTRRLFDSLLQAQIEHPSNLLGIDLADGPDTTVFTTSSGDVWSHRTGDDVSIWTIKSARRCGGLGCEVMVKANTCIECGATLPWAIFEPRMFTCPRCGEIYAKLTDRIVPIDDACRKLDQWERWRSKFANPAAKAARVDWGASQSFVRGKLWVLDSIPGPIRERGQS